MQSLRGIRFSACRAARLEYGDFQPLFPENASLFSGKIAKNTHHFSFVFTFLLIFGRHPSMDSRHPSMDIVYPTMDEVYPTMDEVYPTMDAGYPTIDAGYPSIYTGHPSIYRVYQSIYEVYQSIYEVYQSIDADEKSEIFPGTKSDIRVYLIN
jgi:hypothetical protein